MNQVALNEAELNYGSHPRVLYAELLPLAGLIQVSGATPTLTRILQWTPLTAQATAWVQLSAPPSSWTPLTL